MCPLPEGTSSERPGGEPGAGAGERVWVGPRVGERVGSGRAPGPGRLWHRLCPWGEPRSSGISGSMVRGGGGLGGPGAGAGEPPVLRDVAGLCGVSRKRIPSVRSMNGDTDGVLKGALETLPYGPGQPCSDQPSRAPR